MIAATNLKLEVSRTFPHPVEKVFDAWLDPEMLTKFMTPGQSVTVKEATNDPVEGGRFKIVMHAPEPGDMPHEGTYETINRFEQIIFTWESPFSKQEDSTVTLDFKKINEGTHLTLTHVRFESEESRDNHQGGWSAILETLANKL